MHYIHHIHARGIRQIYVIQMKYRLQSMYNHVVGRAESIPSLLLLTQIRNIKKTILPTQMPLTILKTCVSISAMKCPHVTLAPSFPLPPLHIPARQSD